MGHRAKQHNTTSLMCGGERDGDEIYQGGDAQEDLDVGHSEGGADRSVGKRWEGRADGGLEGGEVEGRGAEVGGDGEAAVVELNGGGVLEEVPPPQIRLVGTLGVARVEELFSWGCETTTHEGEFIIEQTGVKTSDEGT